MKTTPVSDDPVVPRLREQPARERLEPSPLPVDEYGWPHPALLSYYEMVAKNQRTIDMAVWKNSSTANNLRQSGKVTLMINDHALNYYLKGTVSQTEAEMSGTPAVSRFRVTLEQVIEDQEPNAEITTGLTYRRMSQRDPNDFAAKVFRGLKV